MINSAKVKKMICYILLLYPFYSEFLKRILKITIVNNLDEVLIIAGILLVAFERFLKGNLAIKKISIPLVLLVLIGVIGDLRTGINQNYLLISTFLTIKVFLMYLLFEDCRWTEEDLLKIKNALGKTYFLIIVCGYLFYFFPRIAPFPNSAMVSICWHPGIFATLMVPIVLYLFVDMVENKKYKNGFLLMVLVLCLLLARTTKNIISVGIGIMVYLIISKKKTKYIFAVIAITVGLSLSNAIIAVMSDDINAYFLSETAQNRPRIVLLTTSLQIAKDYFPFGSGFGTFGGSIASKYYSDIYYQYGLSGRNGLSFDNRIYLTDTYWPYIIAETGILGTLLLISILIVLLKSTLHNIQSSYNKERVIGYSVFVIFIALIVESMFTSTFLGVRCYLGLGILGIYNSYINRNRRKEKRGYLDEKNNSV